MMDSQKEKNGKVREAALCDIFIRLKMFQGRKFGMLKGLSTPFDLFLVLRAALNRISPFT